MAELDGDPEVDVGGEAEPTDLDTETAQPSGDVQESEAPEGADAEDAEGLEGTDEDDLVETEIGGRTYKVPRELHEGRLRQQDYTRKTQAIAERERAFEAQERALTEQAEVSQELQQLGGTLAYANQQLHQLSQVNMAELSPEDQNAVRAARQDWRDYRDGVQARVDQGLEQSRAKRVETVVKRAEVAVQNLSRDIPGWRAPEHGGQGIGQQVAEHMLQNLGFTPQQLGLDPNNLHQCIVNEPMLRMAHGDMMYRRLAAKRAAPKAPGSVSAEQPITTVSARRGDSKSRRPLADLDMEDYAKARAAGRTA